MKRGSGVLLHISSLPSAFGIGTFGGAAYEFIDFLKRAGQKYWQILPLSPTGFGDSPYQSYSTFAGNPYFIDLDKLAESGNLSPDDYRFLDWGSNLEFVDYGKLFQNRMSVLKIAYKKDRADIEKDLLEFRSKEAYWIENYAMFMALKYESGLKPYWKWDEDILLRKPEAMANAYDRLAEEIEFWVYVQYRFFEQWNKLKNYANENGIEIIGDIPMYVAEDSADAWAHDEILQLDEKRRPIAVAGCPPDYFSPKGQMWGNPLYDWERLKEMNYEWWVLRIKKLLNTCDIVRIDHFRAFSEYYSIPYGDEDATGGKWIKGPGKDFFDVLKRELSENPKIIAEDLGTIDDKVRDLLKYTKFPGMKVLQFAFDPSGKSEYLPHKYEHNCVAYIGTHDNDTAESWLKTENADNVEFARRYMRLNKDEGERIGFIKSLLASPADVAIITMQDILGLGESSRMNVPSRADGNWQWRLMNNFLFFDSTADWIRDITELYGR